MWTDVVVHEILVRQQIRDAQDVKIKAILTAEQRAQFDTLKAEREAHRSQYKQQQ